MSQWVAVFVLMVSLVGPGFAQAQQPRIIGILSPGSRKPPDAYLHFLETFRQSLRDFGYTEGKEILFEYRYADGKLDRMPYLVAELVHLNLLYL